MKYLLYVLLFSLSFKLYSYSVKQSDYPSIFLVKKKTKGFMSLEELKNSNKTGHQNVLFNDLLTKVNEDLKHSYITPTTDFSGRNPAQRKYSNVSYDLEIGLSERIYRLSLMYMITREEQYKNLVIQQIKALDNETIWPMWCDNAHVIKGQPNVDIRTFRISMAVALAYNWLYNDLSNEDRKRIVNCIDRRAIQPFWKKLEFKPGWSTTQNNWYTNIFGGMGITAMALGKNHPETQKILDITVPKMMAFNTVFGKMGEFNEPPGYAGAVKFSVEFAEAYRYYTNNKRNLLKEKGFPDLCQWIMYHTLPGGRLTTFGDTDRGQEFTSLSIIAANASANNDGILQWYYLNYYRKMHTVMELIWFNPKVKPLNPQGRLPLGMEYKQYGASIISRTSWNPISTESVVYTKIGRETHHHDNDIGQLCIDGFGKELIVDLGKPNPIYPKDYFGKNQYEYYTRSTKGHNILVIDDKEIKSKPNKEARGKTTQSFFDDTIGSSWEFDLSPVYKNAEEVCRRVAHLFPGIVVVHDYAKMKESKKYSLNWHTAKEAVMTGNDAFHITNENATISAKVISLNGDRLKLHKEEHKYKSPYNMSRLGEPLHQSYDPYIKIEGKSAECSILSIFAISENNNKPLIWEEIRNGWKICIKNNEYTVLKKGNGFELSSGHKKITIR